MMTLNDWTTLSARLRSTMQEGADELSDALSAAEGVTAGHASFIRSGAEIRIRYTFRKDGLDGKPRQDTVPRVIDPRDLPALGDALVAALTTNGMNGEIRVLRHRQITLWHCGMETRTDAPPAIEVLRAKAGAGAVFIPSLNSPPGMMPDLLPMLRRAGHHALERGGEVLVHSPSADISAHARMRAAEIRAIMAPDGAFPGWAPYIDYAGCDHVLWRTPVGTPDAVLLVCLTTGDRDGTVRRQHRGISHVIAIASLEPASA